MSTTTDPTRRADLNLFAAALTLYLVFNAFDLFSTLFMVGIGVAREINPFMKWVWTFGTPAFIAVKTVLSSGTAWLLWGSRSHTVARWTLGFAVATYTALVLQQVYMMFHIMPILRYCFQ